ncbi:ABC transporter permease [Candidatus Atribacteria bacterium HGW-Atribacteria-1]|nr:MAG: ABC transporter permease [Candidatus Atribacteria bacterium HGW-Atribacteria-1]
MIKATTREKIAGYLFILPLLVYTGVFLIAPAVMSLFFSMTQWNMRTQPIWIGIENYKELVFNHLKYPYFGHSFWITIKYTLMAVPMGIGSGFCLALLINSVKREKIESFFKVAFYLPVITSSVAVAAIWKWIYDSRYGLLNIFLAKLGFEGQNWLGDARTALFALAVLAMWGCGVTMIIYLAGLKGISPQFYEAAKIDGASALDLFWYITLPLLRPVTFFLTVTGVIASFQIFEIIYVLYGAGGGSYGGPNNSTLTYIMYLYNHAFRYGEMGVACAMSFILFILILILTILQFKILPQSYD